MGRNDASTDLKWYLSWEDHDGYLLVKWGTSAHFRAQDGKIVVYKGLEPSGPDADKYVDCEDNRKTELLTNIPWAERTKHAVGWIARNSYGEWQYVIGHLNIR